MQNTNLELILFTITASIVILSTVTFVVFIIYKIVKPQCM
jgi:hypothetical protein